MKTKIIAALLTPILLFSFAACGKTDTDATTTTAVTTVQTTLQEEASATVAETTTDGETATAASTTVQSQTDARTQANTTVATTKATTQTPSTTAAANTFNAAQLAEFNGKNGNAAYVAYNGIVYDVTSTPTDDTWKNGEHKGLLAGTDITDDINNCRYHIVSDFFQKVWARKNYSQVGTYIS